MERLTKGKTHHFRTCCSPLTISRPPPSVPLLSCYPHHLLVSIPSLVVPCDPGIPPLIRFLVPRVSNPGAGLTSSHYGILNAPESTKKATADYYGPVVCVRSTTQTFGVFCDFGFPPPVWKQRARERERRRKGKPFLARPRDGSDARAKNEREKGPWL